jgi:uncharacterized membrane protein
MTSSRATTLAGLGLAATGVAHFVVPDAFLGITRAPFPHDTAAWVPRNGACETVVGAAIAYPPTRRAGLVGLAGYVGWLGFNVAKHR